MAVRISPIGSDTTFDINGAHVSAISQGGHWTPLRTIGPDVAPEMEDKWYDTKHRAVVDAMHALERALIDLAKEG